MNEKLIKTAFAGERKKGHPVSLKLSQIEYFKSLENGSAYIQWLLDNDTGYQKFMKERDGEQKSTTQKEAPRI